MDTAARILIADDTTDFRKMMVVFLKKEGYTVFEAGNGEEALKIIDETPIDLMISDILMPDMDGIELVKKTIELYPELKIILISGGLIRENTFDYLSAAQRITGINNTLKKPFTHDALIDMTKALLLA